ncbi:MAG TPA: cation-translocating P-type ATPase C-terminal domain-containing protein, partial [Chitinophagaceae bacterium]|nr:cation-translocating P-type ATPase C-terminal domain-containing protein [Chitinophagaceae bacterium]
LQKPRDRNVSLFTQKELLISFLQGAVIAAGALALYYYFMHSGASLEQTRTIVFTTLILSNVFLTFANRSFSATIYYTSRYKNNLASAILILSIVFLLSLHLVPFVRNLFQLGIITAGNFWLCICVSFFSVMWFEVHKHFTKK